MKYEFKEIRVNPGEVEDKLNPLGEKGFKIISSIVGAEKTLSGARQVFNFILMREYK